MAKQNTNKTISELYDERDGNAPQPVQQENPLKSLYDERDQTRELDTQKTQSYGLTGVGESKYDIGITGRTIDNLNEIRAQSQSNTERIANAFPRLISKTLTEVAKTPGYIYALGNSIFTDDTLAKSLNNSWLNTLPQSLDDKTKQKFPIYVPEAVQTGNLWDNITSIPFWTTDGVDALGYLLSSMIPGAALKSVGVVGMLSKVGMAAKTAQNIELAAATVMSSAHEALSEAKGIVDDLKPRLDQQVSEGKITQQEADEKLATAGRESFLTNMVLLIGPNALMNKNLLGRFVPDKGLLTKITTATGELKPMDKLSKLEKLSMYAKNIGEAAFSEGFIEEGAQFGIEQYEKKLALGKTDSPLIQGILEEYANGLSTTEAQKSIFLGAFLGSMGGTIGTARENRAENKAGNNLFTLLKNNFEGYSNTVNSVLKKDENGNTVLDDKGHPVKDPQKIAELVTQVAQESKASEIKDFYATIGNKEAYDYIDNQQFTRFALPYLSIEGGTELLNKHIDQLSNSLKQNEENTNGLFDNNKETEYTAKQKNRVRQLAKVNESVKSMVENMPLDITPENAKYADAFSNMVYSTAMQEVSKQYYLSERIRELKSEIVELQNDIESPIPQLQTEVAGKTKQIELYQADLDKSIKDYAYILDPKEQAKAFNQFTDTTEKIEQEVSNIKPEQTDQNINTEIPKEEQPKTEAEKETKPYSLEEDVVDSYFDQKDLELADADESIASPDALTNAVKDQLDVNTVADLIQSGENMSSPEILQFYDNNKEAVEEELQNRVVEDQSPEISAKDQQDVSETMTNPVGPTENEISNTISDSNGIYKSGIPIDAEKTIGKAAGVTMMHLYNHTVTFIPTPAGYKRLFRWVHDKDGNVVKDNNSGIDTKALNEIKEKEIVNFKLVEGNTRLNEERIKNIPENKNGLTKGFHESIGIYSKDNALLGFVQLPHEVKLYEGENEEDYLKRQEARERTISDRLAILSLLEQGKEATSIITKKGKGALLVHINNNGTIDNRGTIFTTTNIRDIDKVNGSPVFAFNNGETLVAPSIRDKEVLRELDTYRKWGRKGQVFMLVRSANNSWYPVPVYSNYVTDKGANRILDILQSVPSNIAARELVPQLNAHIYTTLSKKKAGAVQIIQNEEGEQTYINIAGSTYSIAELQQNPVRQATFKEALKKLKQNIEVANINNPIHQQEHLKEYETLTTNAYKDENGNYLVQPYLTYDSLTAKSEETQPVEDKEIVETVANASAQDDPYDFTDEELSGQLPEDVAYSIKGQTTSTAKVDRAEFKTWLESHLPQFSLSQTDLTKVAGLNRNSWGAFRNKVIYLAQDAPNTVAYHEAFHGVFRSLLTRNEQKQYIDIARKIYDKYTEEDIQKLKDHYGNHLSQVQLEELYYEEKMADDFAIYRESTLTVSKKNLLGKITDFFKKIFNFLNLFNRTPEHRLQQLFSNIEKGNYKKAPLLYTKNSFEPAYAEIPGFPASLKNRLVNTISNIVLAEYFKQLNSGIASNKIDAGRIFSKILNDYQTLYNSKTLDRNTALKLRKLIDSFDSFKKEVGRIVAIKGVKISKNILLEETVASSESIEDINDIEIDRLEGQTTKSFDDPTKISGWRSASTRLKLFFSGIPVVDSDNNIKKDEFGNTIYHDMHKLYYYVEDLLIDKYTYQDQIATLQEYAAYRPELQQVINNLEQLSVNTSEEEQERLRNDFKTNFSKQKLAFTLVKFEMNNETGDAEYQIIDANRQTLSKELYQDWLTASYDPTTSEIVETIDGEVTVHGTKEAQNIYNKLTAIKEAYTEKIRKDSRQAKIYALSNKPIIESNLRKMGIEISKGTLSTILNDYTGQLSEFIESINTISKWYSLPQKEATGIEIAAKKALSNIVNMEVNTMLKNYTSNFNNAEGKPVGTVQLPSFISRTFATLTGDQTRFQNKVKELRKDKTFEYSNILKELERNSDLRETYFKASYIDGLKDNKRQQPGSTFTTLSPKDFMAMQIALFQNKAANESKITKKDISKYIYLTPSDKSLGLIIDFLKYNVNIDNKARLERKSEIVDKFYNVVLQEAERIKKALQFKNAVLNQEIPYTEMREHYHYKAKTKLLQEDGTANPEAFNGQAYRFLYIPELNNILPKIVEALLLNDNTEIALSKIKDQIIDTIIPALNKEIRSTIVEAMAKNLIQLDKEANLLSSTGLDISTNQKGLADSKIKELLASFSLNSLLMNIETSKLINGDPAYYKPNDMQKRVYQGISFITNNNTDNGETVRVLVVKDYEFKSEEFIAEIEKELTARNYTKQEINEILGKYHGINATDAQAFSHPKFYERVEKQRGTWNEEKKKALAIADDKQKRSNISEEHRQKIGAQKPFYYGMHYNEVTGTHEPVQVKSSVMPLVHQYLIDNPLLSNIRELMDKKKADMVVFESTLKALMPVRPSITDINEDNSSSYTIELPAENFGIQVDNPNHSYEEENSSARQVRMQLPGNIDPALTYSDGRTGEQIQNEIFALESVNTKEAADNFKKMLMNPDNADLQNKIKEQLTKRGNTENVEKLLEIVDNEFKNPLDFNTLSLDVQYLLTSMWTDGVIRLGIKGGSAVQATALGFKHTNLKEQQKEINKNKALQDIQTSLKWIRKTENGKQIEYVEAAMPAWSKEFFDDNGILKEENSIPDRLRELLIYRIPTEGYHSMLPIRVVRFLPETMSGFILLPYEVTAQFGADFDFDKMLFLHRDFKKDNEGNLIEIAYDSSLPIEKNNVAARNNRILDNYFTVIRDANTLPHLIKPSGFDIFVDMKNEYIKEAGITEDTNFFSSRTQRDLKQRNHIGKILKGMAALHVTGHSYATVLKLESTKGEKGTEAIFDFDNRKGYSLHDLYSTNGRTLVTDELASLLAAVLDDIKNPILQYLNITSNTINTWATIVRAGYGAETATVLTTQPIIVELSNKMDKNRQKLREVNQSWYNEDTVLNEYMIKTKALLDSLQNASQARTIADTLEDRIFSTKLETSKLKQHRKFGHKLANVRDMKSLKEEEKLNVIEHYIYQMKVLNNWKRYSAIARGLTRINSLFQVNNEVGPLMENIVNITEIHKEVTNPNFVITGMSNIPSIPVLQEQIKAHEDALNYMKKQFPYDSPLYRDLKESIALHQKKTINLSRPLLSLRPEDRVLLDGTINGMLLQLSPSLNISSSAEQARLLRELPARIKEIKNPDNDEQYSSGAIRLNTFIDSIKVNYNNKANLHFISLKGTKLEAAVMDQITEAMLSLYRNSNTKALVEDLVKYSLLHSGFFTGFGSYHKLIPVEVLEDMGILDFSKQLTSELHNDIGVLTEKQKERITDQIIRNLPDKFTKVYDSAIFEKNKGYEKDNMSILIHTDEKRLAKFNQLNNFSLGETEYGHIFPEYIRVYNKNIKKALLYKQTDNPGEYKLINRLGMNGRVLEASLTEDLTTSIIHENNNNKKDINIVYPEEANIDYENIPEYAENIWPAYEGSFEELTGATENIPEVDDSKTDESLNTKAKAKTRSPYEISDDEVDDLMNKCK